MSHTNLSNKLVFITGASSGIGEAMARAFGREGCRLVLAARRTQRLEALSSDLKSKYACASHVLPIDLADRTQSSNALDSLPDDFRVPDILINNAGLVRGRETLWNTPLEDFDEMFDTNVRGLTDVCRFFIPKMLDRGSGHCINVGSISGHAVYPGGSVYCASKYAVRALTDTLRMELMDSPLRVSLLSPGAVDTEFSSVRFRGDKATADATYNGYTPLCGEDVAECAVFMASRPLHVDIADMIVYPSAQVSTTMVHRKKD